MKRFLRDNHHYRSRCFAVVPTGFAVDGVVDLLGPRTGDEVAHQIFEVTGRLCLFGTTALRCILVASPGLEPGLIAEPPCEYLCQQRY